MIVKDFVSRKYDNSINAGVVTWSSPSNIALVKYWGKKEHQIPENPSVSFTLNTCKTITTLEYTKKDSNNRFTFEVYLDEKKEDGFKPKIETFFKRIEVYLPFLKAYHFIIKTKNTFPHSSGIASSASGMSALALCLMSVEGELSGAIPEKRFLQKASFLARLGSGSACRSLEGDIVVWGKHDNIQGSSNLFGIKYPYTVHQNFKGYQDTILLVDKGEKQVSSTLGHNLMLGHYYATKRFEQASNNLQELMLIFKQGDVDKFIALVESEALTLHAMMMTSMPYFILMKPNTLQIINRIWAFREKAKSKVCFTLDAGANVHLLYPKKEAPKVLEFIQNELVAYCQNGQYICDEIGFGAKRIV